MGVVRDVTVEQLAQAVGGIDTSGLAKDTTLQATNTALGIINTTLGGITTNDPPTDTTQQSIAAAIINLGTALGSDKANISGDNIASPATFRQNIGASGAVVSSSVTTTTDTLGRISAEVPVDSKCLRFWADGFVIGGYRKDGGNPNRTLVFIRNNDNTGVAVSTNVTLKWDYISS